MSLLGDAIGRFLNVYHPVSTGISHEGAATFVSERYSFYDEKYRVTVIVETVVEDYEEALAVALANEDFESARKLQDIINQRKGNSSNGDS